MYARNFLEYCCFRALALSIQATGHLSYKKFWRLTYDMMVAWETPAAASKLLVNVNYFSVTGQICILREMESSFMNKMDRNLLHMMLWQFGSFSFYR